MKNTAELPPSGTTNMKKIIITIFAVVLIFTGIYFLENKKGVRGYRGLFLTEQDYINAAERYMKDKYGEKFEGEYLFEDDYEIGRASCRERV